MTQKAQIVAIKHAVSLLRYLTTMITANYDEDTAKQTQAIRIIRLSAIDLEQILNSLP